jgi:hypothetical protein
MRWLSQCVCCAWGKISPDLLPLYSLTAMMPILWWHWVIQFVVLVQDWFNVLHTETSKVNNLVLKSCVEILRWNICHYSLLQPLVLLSEFWIVFLFFIIALNNSLGGFRLVVVSMVDAVNDTASIIDTTHANICLKLYIHWMNSYRF